MPQVIFIEPEYTDGPHFDPNDDHPPTGIAKGQSFLADIYTKLVANPQRWANMLMIVTYDEHGGFFDHLAPLPIPGAAGGTSFATTGVRVPGLVVSPHVAPGTSIPVRSTTLPSCNSSRTGSLRGRTIRRRWRRASSIFRGSPRCWPL